MTLSPVMGMLLIPFGCASSSLGLLLMKQSYSLRPDLPAWRNPRWLLGFSLLGVVATVIDVIVLGILPLSVVAPFAGLTIVFSLLLASSGLFPPAETLTRADGAYIVLVLLGVTLVSTFGPHNQESPSLDVLVAALTTPRFACFVAVAYSSAWLRLYRVTSSRLAPPLAAFAASSCGCLSQLFLKTFSTALGSLPASTAHLAAAIVGLACSAPLHLRLLNLTLAGSDISLAVPCYQFLLIACTTAAGGLLFDEFAGLSSTQLTGYSVGVVTASVGLAALSRSSSEESLGSGQDKGAAPSAFSELPAVEEEGSSQGEEGWSDDEMQQLSSEMQPPRGRGRRASITIMGAGLAFGQALGEVREARELHLRETGRSRSTTMLPTVSPCQVEKPPRMRSRRMTL